jgi:hypothetical protein
MEATTTTQTLQRAKCGDCRSLFLVADLDVNPDHQSRRGDTISAFGPCPKCGAYWSATVTASHREEQTFFLVGIKAVRVTTTPCRASCQNSKSLECKCSCGGENHGR